VSNKFGHCGSLRAVVAASLLGVAAGAVADQAQQSEQASEVPHRVEAELIWAKGGPEALDGRVLYQAQCSSCHRTDGKGFRAMYPPLAQSDFFAGNPRRLLAVVMEGLSGPITVNGARYDQIMPPLNYLTDEEIASVTTYVLNNFGNQGGKITVEEVAAYRKAAGIPAPKPRFTLEER
jgi:mono/diheme cytochrome c family protein